jgi:hypothetical protein
MSNADSSDKQTDLHLEIHLERDPETGMWQGLAFAVWVDVKGRENYEQLGGSSRHVYATRAEAAAAMHAVIGAWIPANA